MIRNCISGQIYDSGPVDFTSDLGARFALHRTILKMPGSAKLAALVAKGITSSLDALFLTRFGSQSTDYWQTLLSSTNLGAPFLILCSENDDFVPFPSIYNFCQELQEAGANVKVVKWKSSPHAGHYNHYPIQYRDATKELLEESLSTFIRKIQRYGERTSMEAVHDVILDIICDLQNAAVNSNQSLQRVARGPSDYFFLPSFGDLGSSREEGRERKEKSPSTFNPRISAQGVLGQILFDACVPKNIEEGWDIKFSGSLNGQPYASAHRRLPLSAIKFIGRSRL